ncbi:hypothetical protein [Clostridium sp.]|uniref:hypothetical protein n=1 Tax=Clostridium sp. TaxID=1506 RepID=UPI0025BA2159|nr:hypothetical protein [Clostridium sp.]
MSELKQYGKVAITVEGEFNPNKSYQRLTIVDYQGLSYLSIVDDTTSLPTDKTQWKLLSVQGEKGEKGDKGDKGDAGNDGKNGNDGQQGPPGKDGLDGLDGKDGNNIEFIYKLTLDKDIVPVITDLPSPPDIDDYVPTEYGWKDRAQGISDTYKAEWVCIRKKNELNKWGEWDGPKLWSKYGDTGRDGDGIEYIYTRTKYFDAPANPTPDDINSDKYQEKGDYEGIEYVPKELGWTDNPIGVDEENPYEWVCKRKETNGIWGAYSEPSLWSKFGFDGANGKDGKSVEYIYKLTKNYNIIPDITGMPSENVDDYVPTDYGWTDNPSGIDENNKAEWVCIRKRKEDNTWSNWEGPTLWSNYGEKGKDGDGVEYIYYINNSGISPLNPTPDNIDTDEYQETGEYENIEYVPTSAGWTDEPTGVSESKQFEFVCSRKYRNGKWGRFSNPSLWAKYGEKGDAGQNGYKPKTLYAVTDSTSSIPALDRTNLNPGSIWGAFPSNYTTDKVVWRIDCTVSYDGTQLITEWEGPALAAGTKGIDAIPPNYKIYVYKNSPTKPDKPTGTSQTPSEWSDYPTSISGTWWQCIGTVNGLTNEVTEWSEVLQVNGNNGANGSNGADGKNGSDGISIEFRFAKNQSSISAPSVTVTTREPSGWTVEPPILSTGEYMWMIVAKVNSDNTLNGNWSNPTRISGEQGPQGEQGIKGDTGPAGDPGGIGPQGPSGITGVSFEVKWCLGTFDSYDGTSNPTSSNTTGWLDYIPTVTEEKPYIWSIQGKKVYANAEDTIGTINWGVPFRLSGINGINGLSGKGIESVKEYYGVSSNSTIEPQQWYEGEVPELTTTNRFLWNYEVTKYSDGTNITTSKRIIGAYGQTGQKGADGINGIDGKNGENGVGISRIEEYYLASNLNSGVTNNTAGFTTTIQTIGKDKPYLWNYSKVYFTDNTTSISEAIIIGHFGQDGANGKKGQVIYPMGIYNNVTSYTTTEDKAPYVYDTLDGNYYVLNAIMTWLGTEQGNRSPSEDFALNNGHYWLKIEGFDAVFTKILIASNGLVGAAVFNGDYLFSQTGYDPTNNNAITTEYQDFNHDDVYNKSNTFIPMVCLNLRTGETSFGINSAFKITSEGKIKLGLYTLDENGLSYDKEYSGVTGGKAGKAIYSGNLLELIWYFSSIRSTTIFSVNTNDGTANFGLLRVKGGSSAGTLRNYILGCLDIDTTANGKYNISIGKDLDGNKRCENLYLAGNNIEINSTNLTIENLFAVKDGILTKNELHYYYREYTYSSTYYANPSPEKFKDNYVKLSPTKDNLLFTLNLPTYDNVTKGFYCRLTLLNTTLYNISLKIIIMANEDYHNVTLTKLCSLNIVYFGEDDGLHAYIQNI